MSRHGSRPRRPWSLQPSLHKQVLSLLREDGLRYKFYPVDDEDSMVREHDSHVMGRFECRNGGCRSEGWNSKMIAVTIRQYESGRYNVRVYHQRCKKCGDVGFVSLDESYAQRVAHWIKKWNGVQVEEPQFVGFSRRPHNSALCEGCAAGRCRGGR